VSESIEYKSLVTHFDLDGVACAALCSLFWDFERISFAGPSNMHRLSYDLETVVTDLPHPYPRECGFWFDHHMANIGELQAIGVDHTTLTGIIEEKPSCLRVVHDYFSKEYELDEWKPFVDELDLIDGFLFRDFNHWMEITPAKSIDHAIKLDYNDFPFMRRLVTELRDNDFTDVAALPDVVKKAEQFRAAQAEQIPLIGKVAKPLPGAEEIILLDLRELKNPPNFEKNLAYYHFPEGKSVLTIRSMMERGVKTNNISLSMSLGFVSDELKSKINIGEMMRTLNIGSGHPGAAAGRFECKSKDERERKSAEVLQSIAAMWNAQKAI